MNKLNIKSSNNNDSINQKSQKKLDEPLFRELWSTFWDFVSLSVKDHSIIPDLTDDKFFTPQQLILWSKLQNSQKLILIRKKLINATQLISNRIEITNPPEVKKSINSLFFQTKKVNKTNLKKNNKERFLETEVEEVKEFNKVIEVKQDLGSSYLRNRLNCILSRQRSVEKVSFFEIESSY
ncbi:MAG: hypothetical protein ACXAC7_07305 [Candidatus Hodarchaeales archaeon]|jgi:hypothetical protein